MTGRNLPTEILLAFCGPFSRRRKPQLFIAMHSLSLAAGGWQCRGQNKIGNWYVYRGANDSAYQEKRRFKFCKWLVHQFWIDFWLDIATIVAFGLATWDLFTVFGSR